MILAADFRHTPTAKSMRADALRASRAHRELAGTQFNEKEMHPDTTLDQEDEDLELGLDHLHGGTGLEIL